MHNCMQPQQVASSATHMSRPIALRIIWARIADDTRISDVLAALLSFSPCQLSDADHAEQEERDKDTNETGLAPKATACSSSDKGLSLLEKVHATSEKGDLKKNPNRPAIHNFEDLPMSKGTLAILFYSHQ